MGQLTHLSLFSGIAKAMAEQRAGEAEGGNMNENQT